MKKAKRNLFPVKKRRKYDREEVKVTAASFLQIIIGLVFRVNISSVFI
jgi:hypothetical protein